MTLAEIVVVLLAVATCGIALPPVALREATSLVHADVHPKGPTKLLQAFGLSQPGVRRWHSEPPQYMLDLYNEVAEPNGLTRLPGPYGATVIRAFSEKDGSSESRFAFSVSGFEVGEETLQAELHVYHARLQKAHRHLLDDNLYTLEVSTEVEGERRVLAKQHVAAHSSGWRVFQVGNRLMKVTAPGREVEDVEEGADDDGDERQVVLQVIAKTLQGSTLPLAFHHGLQGTRRPLLVFFNTYVPSDSQFAPALHRGVDKPPVPRKEYEAPSINRLRRSAADEETTTTVAPALEIPSGCERRDMLVDFASIGWSSWIVYPTSYNAYQCLGQCSFPLGQDLNPTNHAIVQSIINNSGDFPLVQRPCCVPSTYGNLSLLYYDADENVVLKQYDKMVAIECGCH
ncbi:bone morphogenetic protein 2-like isoform X2 [Macrobrachium rosenbergii]|uniref:bone morphogenetic protein 2-like isoform X2 n=1 Tax=Macrobrachium rosenbergii TaxID=79674 RepID=UPI0034D3C7BA